MAEAGMLQFAHEPVKDDVGSIDFCFRHPLPEAEDDNTEQNVKQKQ